MRVRGNWLFPPSILGRFAILCAVARQIHLILSVWMTAELGELQPTDFFVDQLSVGLPLLRVAVNNLSAPRPDGDGDRHCVPPPRPSIFFYCHFPDLLLARGRERLVKRLYRLPFDTLEEWSMGYADAIAVNSSFTKGIVARTWPKLAVEKKLSVVYPCVDVSEGGAGNGNEARKEEDNDDGPSAIWPSHTIFLSINRFERKKDVGLAVRAFSSLYERVLAAGKREAKNFSAVKPRLVVAGGYDTRISENVEHHHELEHLATKLGLSHATARTLPTALAVPENIQVVFLPSVTNRVKDALLRRAALLLYTPQNEHFGIVPLEAMLKRLPVLAVDSGGPRETVGTGGEAGWLVEPDAKAWGEVMFSVLGTRDAGKGRADLQRMGETGRDRVQRLFGRDKMGETLDEILEKAGTQVRKVHVQPGQMVLGLLAVVCGVAAVVITVATRTLPVPSVSTG